MFSWLFIVFMDVIMKEMKIGGRGIKIRFIEKGRDWRLLGSI